MSHPCRLLADAEWHITPSMTIEGSHDDNFFRSETDKASVWAIQYAPGVAIEGLTDRSRLNFTYNMGYFEYFGTRPATSKTPALDVSSLDYLSQNMAMYAATKLYTRLLVGVKEEYLLTREPGSTDNFNQLVTRDKYWVNRVTPFISYDIGEKGELKLAYRNEELEYIDAPDRPDSSENRAIVTGTYNMNSTNHLDLEEQVWQRDYTGLPPSSPNFESNYDAYQTRLIYRRDLSSWLTAQVAGGYQVREFAVASVPNIYSPVYSIGAVGATDRTKLALSFEHGVVDFTLQNAYFKADRVNAAGQYIFWEVLRAYMGGYWQLSDYIGSPRQDNTYNIYAGVGYSFLNKFLELSVEYNRTNDDSNTPGFNYTDNIIYLRLTAKYDFPKR